MQRPSAFLLTRLRMLPPRPAGTAHRGLVGRVAAQKPRDAHDSVGETRGDAAARTARWYTDVMAVTTEQQRATLLRAHTRKFGAVVDVVAAIASAGRRAARLHPQVELAEALTRWAGEVLGDEPDTVAAQRKSTLTPLSLDLLMDLAIGNCDCVVCGSGAGISRDPLPLKSSVCDRCWPVIAAELDRADDQGMRA